METIVEEMKCCCCLYINELGLAWINVVCLCIVAKLWVFSNGLIYVKVKLLREFHKISLDRVMKVELIIEV